VHRDISYTNILLREVDDNPLQKGARKKVMTLLGLQDVDQLRQELKCREGLLIDFDYATVLADLEAQIDEARNVELRSVNEEEEVEEGDDEDEVVLVEDNEGDEIIEEESLVTRNSDNTPAPDPSGARTVRFHKINGYLSCA